MSGRFNKRPAMAVDNAFQVGKFYLYGTSKGKNDWGRISPGNLSFSSKEEGEQVKKRYEQKYPNQVFEVRKYNG